MPYKRRKYERFVMGNLSDSTTINWTLYERGADKKILESYSKTKNKRNTKAFNFNEKESDIATLLSLEAQAETEGNPKVEIFIEKEVKKFDYKELKAIDNENKNRVAKSGETLYYVHQTGKEYDFRSTSFQIDINPKIPENEIPTNHIEWIYNGTNIDHDKLSLSRTIHYNDDNKGKIEIQARTGNPMAEKYKKVNVEWVEERRRDASFMPPAVNHTIQTLNKDVLDRLQKAVNQMTKTLGIDDLKVEINPIKIKGETYNEQDKDSRHYFEVLEGSVNGGLSLNAEVLAYPVILKILNIKNVSKVGMYINPKIEFAIAGGGIKRKIAETQKLVKNQIFLEAALKGCIETGLKAELLKGKEYVDFYVSGFGEACASGRIKYNFTTQKLEGGVYLDPVILGVKAKIKSKGVFEFELVDIDRTWSITEKIIIKEYEKEFK
ncbi:hypothetical protein ACI76O_11490 [Capnocytophaga cynodegmi]